MPTNSLSTAPDTRAAEGTVNRDGTASPTAEYFQPFGGGPLNLYDDDKHSALRDEWYSDAREWLAEFREECRDL